MVADVFLAINTALISLSKYQPACSTVALLNPTTLTGRRPAAKRRQEAAGVKRAKSASKPVLRTTEVVDAVREIHANVNFAVGIRNFKDHFHPGAQIEQIKFRHLRHHQCSAAGTPAPLQRYDNSAFGCVQIGRSTLR